MKKYFAITFLSSFFLFSFHTAVAQNVKYQEKKVQVTQHNIAQLDEAAVRQKMKADGLSQPVIDKLIAQRKLWTQRGGNYNWMSAKNGNPVVNAPCNGLGVESGWGAWMWQNGTNSGANPPVWSGAPAANPATSPAGSGPYGFTPSCPSGGSNLYYEITSGAGIDCNTPGPVAGNPTIPIVCPGFGSSSIKIGDGCGIGSNCNQLTYALTVTPQDTNFVFAYAVVIEDAGHLPNEQPFCEIGIYDSLGNPVKCVPLIYTGGPSIPGFYGVSGNGCAYKGLDQYKPWTLVGVNLQPYLGKTLNVVITNCDCVYGGHFCYSYWDFLCGTASLSAGCLGNQSTVCGPVDPNIAYTYQWYLNGSAIPPPQGTQQCITITSQPGDTLTVEVQQPSTCNFHLMYVPASVQPDFDFKGNCGTFTFADSTTASPSSVTITGWNWSFPGGNPTTANTQTATVTYSNAGTYSVTLTVTCSAGCTATITHTVNVTALPTALFSTTTACKGYPITLTNQSQSPAGDPITSWVWTIPGGNPTAATGTLVTTIYSTPGQYVVTLTVTTASGCPSTITHTVTVYAPPVANFVGAGSGCAPICLTAPNTPYLDQSTAGTGAISQWQWNFPGGTPPAFSSTTPPGTPPTICYNAPGTYSASLFIIDVNGCTSSKTITPTATVYGWPKANFCVTPDQAPSTDPLFNFCDLWTPLTGSDSVVAWTWDFGDGTTLNDSVNPIHNYTATVTGNDFYNYTVCLHVQNIHGCWDSTCRTVELLPEFVFYIPNTFTPNGDYHNELFYGKGRGIKEYHIWLFDRWGNLIWDCYRSDSNVPWDYNGIDGLPSACQWDGKVVAGGPDFSGDSRQLVQEDVYVWKVKLTDVFDRKHSYIGNVNVVK